MTAKIIFTDEQMAEIRRRYEAGESTMALAKTFGVSQYTMYRVVKESDIHVRTIKEANAENCRQLGLNSRVLADEEEAWIAKEYLDGATLMDLAKKHGTAGRTILLALKRQGVPCRPNQGGLPGKGKGRLVLLAQEIKNRYEAGQSTPKIAVDLGVATASVWRSLQNLGVPFRDASTRVTGINRKKKVRRIPLDESVFDTVTEESAYWVGFLMADGSVHRRERGQPSISLSLAEADAAHVVKYREFLRSGHKISVEPPRKKFPGSTPAHRLTVVSRRLVDVLEQYGVRPDKTYDAKAADSVKINPHFWRGMIDGDGSVSIIRPKKYRPFPQITLCGTRFLLQQFVAFAKAFIPEWSGSLAPVGSIWSVCMMASHAQRMACVLYRGAAVALDRKMATAQQAMAWETAQHCYDWVTADLLRSTYARVGSWRGVSEKLGLPPHAANYLRKRLGVHIHDVSESQPLLPGMESDATTHKRRR